MVIERSQFDSRSILGSVYTEAVFIIFFQLHTCRTLGKLTILRDSLHPNAGETRNVTYEGQSGPCVLPPKLG